MAAVSTRKRAGSPAAGRDASDGQYRVRRFDADRSDREITLEDALASSPTSRQLLWVDVVGEIDRGEVEALSRRFELDDQTEEALERPSERAELVVHGTYFHLSVAAPPEDRADGPPVWLHVVAGRNVVVTRHIAPLPLLDEIDERIKSDASLGAVEAAEFVALLLDGVVTRYFAAVDAIEDAIDDLDARSLRDEARHDGLDDMIRLRRRIARLRRVLAAHRSLFSALTGPDLRQLVKGRDAIDDLQAVANRYESAVGVVESSRQALLGSFDVYTTQTAQRTNEVVKILTVATVLLLPGSVVAGFLGMNVIVPLNKDDPLSFWLVVGAVGLLAVLVLGVARLKRWI
jgi:Mg2+ and Co2+ transporter CorA